MTRTRLMKLQKCHTWYIQEIVKSNWYRDELYRVDALCPQGTTEKWLLHDVSLANPGHMAFPVGGSRFCNRHLSGSSFIEGKRFYRLAQLRCFSDNFCSRQARPPLVCNKCNTGQMATLQHILCQCRDNEAVILRRHNMVLKELVTHCKNQKLTFTVEPTFGNGLRPDIIVKLPNGTSLCLDVTIVFELSRNSLIEAGKIKQEKYKQCLPEMSSHLATPLPNCHVYGLVFGARGSIAAQTINVLEQHLKMPKWRIDKMINQVIHHSLNLFEHSPAASRA